MRKIIMVKGGRSCPYDNSLFYPVFQSKPAQENGLDCIVLTIKEDHPCKNEAGELWLTYLLGGLLRDNRGVDWYEIQECEFDENGEIIISMTLGYAEAGD